MSEALPDCVAALVLPGRRHLGALPAALRKHGIQFIEGWPSEALRRRHAAEPALCLTLAGFAATPAARGRITLPEALVDALYEVAAAAGAGVELALLLGADDAPRHAPLSVEGLHGPLAPGCRYRLLPPPPRTDGVPGRPEVEGWLGHRR